MKILSGARLHGWPIAISIATALGAFIAGALLVGLASINDLLPGDAAEKVLLTATLTNGLASFTGVLAGTACARENRRAASLLIAGFLVAFYVVADAVFVAIGLAPAIDSATFFYFVAWVLGAVAAAFIARQRY